MGASKRIRMAMIDKGIKPRHLEQTTGIKSQLISNSLNKDNMTFKRVEMLAEALGCEVVLRDKETGRIY